MRKLLTLWIALAAIVGASVPAFAQMSPIPGFPPGTFQNRAAIDAPSGGGGTLSLDGHSSSTSTAGQQIAALTTTTGSGQVCAATYGGSGAGAVTSVTATGLTFAKAISSTDGTGNTTEAWCSPFTTNFSGNITVNWTSASALTNATVFGIGGAATSSAVDSTGFSTSGQPSITTTNANTFIFSIQSDGFTPTAGGSFTLIDPGGGSFFNTSEYLIVSAVQRGLVAAITGTSTGGIVVAIKN